MAKFYFTEHQSLFRALALSSFFFITLFLLNPSSLFAQKGKAPEYLMKRDSVYYCKLSERQKRLLYEEAAEEGFLYFNELPFPEDSLKGFYAAKRPEEPGAYIETEPSRYGSFHLEYDFFDHKSFRLIRDESRKDDYYFFIFREDTLVNPAEIKVFRGGKKLKPDPKSGAYFFKIKNTQKTPLIEVTDEKISDFFIVDVNKRRQFSPRRIFYGLRYLPRRIYGSLRLTTLRTIQEISNLYTEDYVMPLKIARLVDSYYRDYIDKDDEFSKKERINGRESLIIPDKPVYRKGDTIRTSVLVFNTGGMRPYRQDDLAIRFTVKVIEGEKTTLKSFKADLAMHSPGIFSCEREFPEDLKIQDDSEIRVSVFSKKNRFRTLISDRFLFSDYELPDRFLSYTLKDPDPEDYDSTFKILKIAVRDIQERIVPGGGSLELKISKASDYSPGEEACMAYFPDFFLRSETELDTREETEIPIPRNVLPGFDLPLSIEIKVTDDKGETHFRHFREPYKVFPESLVLYRKNDSVFINDLHPNTDSVWLTRHFSDERERLAVPFSEKIPAQAKVYKVWNLHEEKSLTITNLKESEPVKLSAFREDDFYTLKVQNEENLPVSVFKHDKRKQKFELLQVLREKEKDFRFKTENTEPVVIRVAYPWQGSINEQTLELGNNPRELSLEVEAEPIIRPGDSSEFVIRAKNASGKSMANTGIVMRGANAKFEKPYSDVLQEKLYLPEQYPNREEMREKKLPYGEEKRPRFYNIKSPPNVKQILRLSDSSQRTYQFMSPGKGFFRYEQTKLKLSRSKLCLHAFKHNKALRIIMVLNDNDEPVYFAGADPERIQAFEIKAGRRKLKVLTEDSVLHELPEIFIPVNSEVFMSFDAEGLPHKKEKRETMLTDAEIRRLKELYICIENDISNYEGLISFRETSDVLTMQRFERKRMLLYAKAKLSERFVIPGLKNDRHSYESARKKKQYAKSEYTIPPLKPEMKLTFGRGDCIVSSSKEENLLTYINYAKFDALKLFREMNPHFTPLSAKWTTYPASNSHQVVTTSCNRKLVFVFSKPIIELSLKHEDKGLFEYVIDSKRHVIIERAYRGKFDVRAVTVEGDTLYQEREGIIKELSKGGRTNNSERTSKDVSIPGYYSKVSGTVKDETGETLPGVSVVLKDNPKRGTQTDIEGRFSIRIPPRSTLIFSFPGMENQEVNVSGKREVNVTLVDHELNAVVFVGYSSDLPPQRSLGTEGISATATLPVLSVDQALQGQAAGVQVMGRSKISKDEVVEIQRTLQAVETPFPPLLYLNGLRVPLSFLKKMQLWPLQPDQPVTFVPPAEALGLYGEEASEGAFLFETERYTEAQILKLLRGVPLGEKKGFIRSDFRDVAVWAPTLQTDENGEARLRVKFPDNITRWRTEAWAVHPDRWNGHRKIYIDARLEQSAQLFAPRFLVRSDSIMLHGKCENYATDTLSLQTRFRAEEKTLKEQSDTLRDFFSHYAPLSVPEKETHFSDSLTLEFAAFENGQVADGERREVPLMPKGLLRREGSFVFAERDTSFTLSADKGDLQLNFGKGYQDLIRSEFHYFKSYKHKCNEQLSSMLTAYLLQKQAHELSGEVFSHDEFIQEMAEELQKRQNTDGGWGLWPNEESSSFYTTYVLKALKYFSEHYENEKLGAAFKQGFSFLEASFTEKNFSELKRIQSIIFLLENHSSAQLRESALAMIDSLPFGESRIYESLLQLRVSQLCGRDVSTIFLEKTRLESAEGAYFWRDRGYYRFTKSEIILTSLALDIASSDSLMKSWVPKIRSYFLQLMRNPEGLRNTYEKALVLRTLYEGGNSKGSEIRLNDKPVLKDEYSIMLSKGEKAELYLPAGAFLSAFREFREEPDSATTHPAFSLKTYWPESDTLQVGSRIELTAEIEVFREAEFTVLEIPIPAACAFTENRPTRESGEAYREYRRDRVLIYYNTMPVGLKRIRIPLDVKFAGRFVQNPALLESMYEPTMQAFEKMKSVLAEEDND